MSETKPRFVDRSGYVTPKIDLWPSIVISKEEIEAEVDRLASLPPPANGRRRSLIVHPNENGTGLAPGIQVALDVLKPGERTKPIRHNSSQVNFCIRGRGHADGQRPADQLRPVRRLEYALVQRSTRTSTTATTCRCG